MPSFIIEGTVLISFPGSHSPHIKCLMTLCWAYPVWLGLGWQKLLSCWTHFWASACPALSSGLTQQTAASLCSIPPLDSGSHKPGQREAENIDMVDRVMSLAGCHCLSFQRCSSLFELENFGLNSTISDTNIVILSFQQFACIFLLLHLVYFNNSYSCCSLW